MKPKISIITLGVKDVEKSINFYHKGLGFKLHNYKKGDDSIFLKLEGTWLGLYPKEKLAKDIGINDEDSGFSGITLTHNVKSELMVNRIIDHAVSSGAKLIKKPQKVFWGGYSGYFSDPDGYFWEVACNPFTDLT